MLTKSWRHWGPWTVVLTVGVVGLGLGISGAPAGDSGGAASLPGVRAGAVPADTAAQAPGPRAPRAHKEGQTTIAGPKREVSAPVTGDRAIRTARIVSAVPIGPAPSTLTSTGVLAGGTCDCDDDCGPPSGPCKLARCNSNTGTCEEVDALFGARCDLDANWCTNDRCDGVGGCVANPLSPCSHHCVGGSRNGEDCVTHADCPGVINGCTPDGTCDSPTQTCALNPDIGRCCLADGTCSHVTKANCDAAPGLWLRVQDSEADLDHCVCPKYGSGIAPRDAQVPPELGVCSVGGTICTPIGSSCGGTGTCVNRNPVGPVTRAPKACSIDAKPCEDAGLDCAKRCNNDPNLTCTADADCGAGNSCTPQTCDDNVNACHGLLSVGDDYTITNGSYMRLREFRFRGGVRSPKETLVFEFYDNSATPLLVGSFSIRFTNGGNFYYNIEVDCAPECDAQEDQVPRDPPLIIPPSGHVVIRSDRDNADPDTQDEHSEGFWLAADNGTDVGSNDPDRMWIDGNKNTNYLGTGRNVLAFELVGEKVPDPLGACCDPQNPQNCVDNHEWECRTCAGGPFDGQLCKDFRDCGGVAQGSCTSVNWQGQRLLNDPPGLLCSAGPCDIGACCLANGTCEERDESQCTNPNVFQGFGTSCTPNCCDQPVATGGDCCKDTLLCSDGSGTGTCTQVGQNCGTGGTCQLCGGPTVLNVTVPPPDPQDPPVILRTMSGDSTSASFDVLEGDTCAQGANDPGWYEAIHVDKCAELTVDLCCNAPVVSPTWIIVFDSCPCDADTNSIFPDTRRSGYGPSDADGPNEAAVICADENWSGTWTVRAGTYWFQIFAGKVCANTVTDCDTNDDCEPGVPCEDNRGPYQLHFTVTPCPEAACCLIDTQTCVPFANRFDCEDRLCRGGADDGTPCITTADCAAPGTCREGVWLGDLDPTPSPDCFPAPTGTCGLGACCTGPGACDDNAGGGVSLTTCQQNQGVYHGGLRCTDEPCPVCPFEDGPATAGSTGVWPTISRLRTPPSPASAGSSASTRRRTRRGFRVAPTILRTITSS
ncbi:MAG: hypothetical protein HY763_10755 [Planctomycetes bacterium]|nr:hypothetical protein [Planctomycetota bacterium]